MTLYEISFTEVTPLNKALELLEDIVNGEIILHSIYTAKNISLSMECSSMRRYIVSKGIKESDIVCDRSLIEFYNENYTLKIRSLTTMKWKEGSVGAKCSGTLHIDLTFVVKSYANFSICGFGIFACMFPFSCPLVSPP